MTNLMNHILKNKFLIKVNKMDSKISEVKTEDLDLTTKMMIKKIKWKTQLMIKI